MQDASGREYLAGKGNKIRLTLLKALLMPDQTADQGLQEFTCAFFPFAGDFQHSRVLQEAALLNEPPLPGSAAPGAPICLSGSGNIIIETIKPADTAERAILVRAYESMGMQTDTTLSLHSAIRHAVETNLLEGPLQPLPESGQITFRPFEFKTFLMYL